MNNGTSNINITGVTCGPGHGIRYRYIIIIEIWFSWWNFSTVKSVLFSLSCGCEFSVGSLGEKGAYEMVEQVHVRNCSFNGSENGLRIKTCPVQRQTD